MHAKMSLAAVLLPLLCACLRAAGDCEAREKYVSGENADIDAAVRFLNDNNRQSDVVNRKHSIATWNYESNLTESNKRIMLNMNNEMAKFSKETWRNATSFAWKEFTSNRTIYRWFKNLAVLGDAALPDDQFEELNELTADLQDIYAKAKVCGYNKTDAQSCNLSLEPELTEIFMSSRNHRELRQLWLQWRDATGRKMKDKFLRYVELSNEAACLNGFGDAGELWREAYESESFAEDVEQLWRTLRPLYEQLHAYARRRLIRKYPDAGIRDDGPIPAHLLGNMWAQQWTNIFDILKPFPKKEFVDVTDNMHKKQMSIEGMFRLSEEFFTSLGLLEMTPEFWSRSILKKPSDRDMVCHASAWDMNDGKDVRIKMCTRINMEDLITVHHEMGHIEYFLQYAGQPAVFREGANPGFHEAVGDTIALSVSTPKHLQKIGLLEHVTDDDESDLNNLLKMALDKIAFLPFGYLIDSWRWKVFEGSVTQDKLNSEWWAMRLKYQGLCPPARRSNVDLDAAAKFHVAADVPYIRYFVSYIIQFQFHKALCEAAGYKGPLHKCDIYENKKAGKRISDTLSLGSSRHWSEAMKVMTGGQTSKMDAGPLVEYFAPLLSWLRIQNRNETIGWKSEDPLQCP